MWGVLDLFSIAYTFLYFIMMYFILHFILYDFVPYFYSPASKASWKVANLTDIKNQQPPYMVSKILSVCLWSFLTPII